MFEWIVGSALCLCAAGLWKQRWDQENGHGNFKSFLWKTKGAKNAQIHLGRQSNEPSHETLELILLKQMERRMAALEARLEQMADALETLTASGGEMSTMAKAKGRVVSDQYQGHLEQILKLSERGASLEEIAKKMKMHKGEVQLLLNLSKKSS